MSGAEIIGPLATWAGIAGDHLAAIRSRIGQLTDGEFRALLDELATEPASDANALISSVCLHESTTRFLKLTLPSHA